MEFTWRYIAGAIMKHNSFTMESAYESMDETE